MYSEYFYENNIFIASTTYHVLSPVSILKTYLGIVSGLHPDLS